MSAAFVAIVLVPLLVICSLAPGLMVVRRLRWSPLEKLCAAFGASFVIIYLASFGLYRAHGGRLAYELTSGTLLIAGCAGWRQMLIFVKHRHTRLVLVLFAALLGWDLLHLGIIRHYSGGDWAADWFEHYDRMRYFLHELPDDYSYAGLYLLTARPPMMNLIEAFFCRQVGVNFEAYSLTSLYLNAFAFVPCTLLFHLIASNGGRLRFRLGAGVISLAILFMLNPSILQNVTYTWTKAFSASYVILGASLYLNGMRRDSRSRLIGAWLSLSAALLAHYSAGPFIAAIAVHHVWMVLSKRRGLSAAFVCAVLFSALLGTWVFWAASRFGWKATFLSNTTAIAASGESGTQIAHKTLFNIYYNLVPHPLYQRSIFPASSIRSWDDLSDYFFEMEQMTLPMMIGSAAGILAIARFLRFLIWGERSLRAEKYFWALFVIAGGLLGTAALPTEYPFGVANVIMQPIALAGVTAVAESLSSLGSLAFELVVLGSMFDYASGILLHFNRESYLYQTTGQSATGMRVDGLTNSIRSITGAREYVVKLMRGYTFWGDDLARWNLYFQCISALSAACLLWLLIKLRMNMKARKPRRKLRGKQVYQADSL